MLGNSGSNQQHAAPTPCEQHNCSDRENKQNNRTWVDNISICHRDRKNECRADGEPIIPVQPTQIDAEPEIQEDFVAKSLSQDFEAVKMKHRMIESSRNVDLMLKTRGILTLPKINFFMMQRILKLLHW